jgi:hypothetical protein
MILHDKSRRRFLINSAVTTAWISVMPNLSAGKHVCSQKTLFLPIQTVQSGHRVCSSRHTWQTSDWDLFIGTAPFN